MYAKVNDSVDFVELHVPCLSNMNLNQVEVIFITIKNHVFYYLFKWNWDLGKL